MKAAVPLLLLLAGAALRGQTTEPPPVVLVRGELGAGHWNSGSGVVIASGVVATNAHVLRGAAQYSVKKGLQSWPATLLRLDEARDLALLRVAGLGLAPATVAAGLRPGQWVQAVGFPGGGGEIRRQGTLTGVWSYLGGQLLQTDAPVAPGCSGGGLFAADGSLLGITTFALPVGPRFNFAVPARWALELLEAEAPALSGRLRGGPLVEAFVDAMAQDPANAGAWDRFTREWIAAAPADPEAWLARSQALDQQLRDHAALGRLDRARLEEGMRASRRALELRPGHARAWNNLGVALDLDGDFAAAEAAFLRALELDPDYGLARLNLGGVRINRKDWDGAAETLRRALQQVPDDAAGWARLGYSEAMRGRWAEAAGRYRIALRYLPWQLELWKDFRQACLKIQDSAGVREAEARIAELGGR